MGMKYEDIIKMYEIEKSVQNPFALVVSGIDVGVVISDASIEGNPIIFVNEGFENITAYGEGEVIGRNCSFLQGEKTDPSAIRKIREAIAQKKEIEIEIINYKKDNTEFWNELKISPVKNQSGDTILMIGTIRDITKKKRAEEEAHEREEILGIVAEAMNTVLKDDDIDSGINKALEILGRGTSVDRIYVFKNHWDSQRDLLAVSQKYEWVNEGIEPEIDNPQLQNLPYKDAGYERWVEYLSRGEVITGLVDEFPESEKEILQMQEIKSMLVVPIIIKKSFWGLIGFDDCTNGKEWSVTERDILTAAASNIGNIIKKHETEKELKLATQKAKEASRAKSEFLSNMSHEIRTPLNIIIGMTEVLMESEISEEERKYIEIVKKSGSTLLDLVNDVLDLSKIESGNTKLNMSRFCLKTMITETSEMLKVRAVEKGVGFNYDVESDVEYNIEADKEKIRQVIINILGNAIKFTEEGEVGLKAKLFKKGDESYLNIAISDSGIGISEEEMDNIFKSFVQVDSQRNKKYSGTGLGLSISKSLVEMMGGRIWVESQVAKGSTFYFEVPVNKFEGGENEDKKCDYDNDIDRKLKILLVDDSQDNRLLIKVFLKKENCVIIEAENGLLGVEAFEREDDIDVILMDMQMPVMDGYNAVRVIREMEKTSDRKRTPIIALTAYAFKEDEKKSLEAGCDYHLTKPIKKDALISIINRFTK